MNTNPPPQASQQGPTRVEDLSDGLTIGYVGGAILLIVFMFIAFLTDDWRINLLLILVFLALGWGAGILYTPQSEAQTDIFRATLGAISTFLVGFALGKFEPVLEPFKTPSNWTHEVAIRVLLAMGSFSVGALFTSVLRIQHVWGTKSAAQVPPS